MGMLLFRVPSDSSKGIYADRLNQAAQKRFGWPCIAKEPYAVLYVRDADGVEFACPGNGDGAITREWVEALADKYANTDMQITYCDDAAQEGFTLVPRGIPQVGQIGEDDG